MKTLWLGCSHSSGAYSQNDNRMHKDGIPYIVSKHFEQSSWKSISCPGQGVLRFATILYQLDKDGILKDTKNLILQLTTEPRLVSFDPMFEKLNFNFLLEYLKSDRTSIYQYDNDRTHSDSFIPLRPIFNKSTVSLYEIYKKDIPKSSHNDWLEICSNIDSSLTESLKIQIPMYYDVILDIVKRNNINLYSFTFTGEKSYDINDYNDILKDETVFSIMKKDKSIDIKKSLVKGFGHPTQLGVNYTSDLIINALKDSDFNG